MTGAYSYAGLTWGSSPARVRTQLGALGFALSDVPDVADASMLGFGAETGSGPFTGLARFSAAGALISVTLAMRCTDVDEVTALYRTVRAQLELAHGSPAFDGPTDTPDAPLGTEWPMDGRGRLAIAAGSDPCAIYAVFASNARPADGDEGDTAVDVAAAPSGRMWSWRPWWRS